MLEIAPGWKSDVDRESDWLLVKLRRPDQNATHTPPLAEALWELLQRDSTHRLVLELDQIEVLNTYLIGQLVLLHKRICVQGGALRLCGLTPHNQEVIQLCGLDDRFAPYRSREEAVLGRPAARQSP
ncbi:MAG: STAS domain-containing protein [Planctomycetota bacterium]|jgi:anti-anti-sigma factor